MRRKFEDHVSESFLLEVQSKGLGVITGVFSSSEIDWARQKVLQNTRLMKNTRPTPSSRHLAGFHRYPQLEQLHMLITSNSLILSNIIALCGGNVRTIGLSDITLNRSQSWHKDLLRGEFSHYLNQGDIWSCSDSGVFKVLLYLQDSCSLKFIPGSHRQKISLESDQYAIPHNENEAQSVNIRCGDVAIMDIRTSHRGSNEIAFKSEEARRHPRILISTAFGAEQCPLTDEMEAGDAVRLANWMRRWT